MKNQPSEQPDPKSLKFKSLKDPVVQKLVLDVTEATTGQKLHLATAKLHQTLNNKQGKYPPELSPDYGERAVRIMYYWLVFYVAMRTFDMFQDYRNEELSWWAVAFAAGLIAFLFFIVIRLNSICQALTKPQADPFDESTVYRS